LTTRGTVDPVGWYDAMRQRVRARRRRGSLTASGLCSRGQAASKHVPEGREPSLSEDGLGDLSLGAVFRVVQERKGTAKAASKNGGDGPLLGGGLLRCSSCGGRLSLDTTRPRGVKIYRFYRCTGRHPGRNRIQQM
jgi:hypothetical protein